MAAFGFPSREEIRALQLRAVAIAMGCAGKPVERPRRIRSFQNEHVRQDALDRARVDIDLIRDIAAFAQAAPIPHQQVTVAIFHGSPAISLENVSP